MMVVARTHVDRPVLELALAATRQLEPEPFLRALVGDGGAWLGGSYALGYLPTTGGEDFDLAAATGDSDLAGVEGVLAPLDVALVRHFAPERPAVLAADALLPTGHELARRLGDLLLAPLESSTGLRALLIAVGRSGRPLVPDAAARAAQLGEMLVPVLDNIDAVAALRTLVIRDDTAECYNRRYLDQCLEDEVERARRFAGRFGLIFLDMDNLKDVNTHHGHAAGSRVLFDASVRIGCCIRSIDRLFRFGGDEFVVLLPGSGTRGACEVADRIRRELAAQPFVTPAGAQIGLTASAGVASWPEHGPSGRGVIEAADAAMRRVKSRGKDGLGVAGTGH
jgi:diguanylate cyclase (GGDEF)-like protein